MKKLIALTAVATATLAGAASAASDTATVTISRYAPNADISTLTDAEVGSILNVINSADSRSEAEGTVKSLIRAYQ